MRKTFELVQSERAGAGYVLVCNGKAVRTPQGREMKLPTEKLAQAVLAEWREQGEKINKSVLKFTPIACVAIDLAADKREAMLADIITYIDTDMLCYRAGDIPELAREQREKLDPVMRWAEQAFGIMLEVTEGIMPVAQDEQNGKRLANVLATYDDWKLAAFSVAVKPLGSVVLALALLEGRINGAEAFALAHLEETYETAKWGEDAEKEQQLEAKKQDVLAVEEFLRMLRIPSLLAGEG